MPLYTVKNTMKAVPPVLVDVWLDGAAISEVLEANTDEGYVVRIKRDESGRLVVAGGKWATERIEGVVTVKTRTMPLR